ncbi:hypothetical protein KM043_011235 [Ampulex compressa]|nr:hypothetical protein KM043_011235 [Ampulex compressa]
MREAGTVDRPRTSRNFGSSEVGCVIKRADGRRLCEINFPGSYIASKIVATEICVDVKNDGRGRDGNVACDFVNAERSFTLDANRTAQSIQTANQQSPNMHAPESSSEPAISRQYHPSRKAPAALQAEGAKTPKASIQIRG